MTGLERLILFLNERNVLSLDEIALLERRGVWTRTRAYCNFEATEVAPECAEVAAEEDDSLYRLEVPGRRRRKGRRRRGRPNRRYPGLTQVAVAMEHFLEEQAPRLQGLLQLGRQLEPCKNWIDAAIFVASATDRELRRACALGLHVGSPTRRSLEAVLKVNPLHALKHCRRTGPVTAGVRAALRPGAWPQVPDDRGILGYHPALAAAGQFLAAKWRIAELLHEPEKGVRDLVCGKKGP